MRGMEAPAVRLTDKAEIRRRLEADRAWSVYALANLDDGLFPLCEWWCAGDNGLGLACHAIPIRPLFAIGSLEETRAVLGEMDTPSGYLNVRREMIAAAAGIYEYRGERHEMCRMVLDRLVPSRRKHHVVPLGLTDLSAVETLYASGTGAGIAFTPWQLATGWFRGIRDEAGALVAVAGAHVVSESESVAGVGNVFVRADWRGQGLAQAVLSAVVGAVAERGIRTVGLNVEHTNAPAIAAYRRLGFQTAFRYYEGSAHRYLAPS